MPTEHVIWTALPNGVHRSGDRLKVTVFVTPRLRTEGLGDPVEGLPLDPNFPTFTTWPDALADTRFAIRFPNPVGTVDAELDPESAKADTGTWRLLFGDCGVFDGEFHDLSTRRIRSLPVKTVSTAVLGLYQQIAEGSPASFPSVTTGALADLGRQLGNLSLSDAKTELYARLDDAFGKPRQQGGAGRVIDRSTFTDRVRMGFVEAYRFYDRPGTQDPLGPHKAPNPPTPPLVDFHAFAGFCGDYPELLRLLGLAVDLLVPWDRTGTPSTGRIRAVVRPPAGADFMKAPEATPFTRYQLAPPRFLPDPKDKEGDLVDGMLRLENVRDFVVNQIDVDGSALKTTDFAATASRIRDRVTSTDRSMTPDAASLPALRNGGFTVARDSRAAQVVDRLDRAAGHESDRAGGSATELWAEDVNRGFRVDVEDAQRPDRWLSLHHRTGTYQIRRGDGGIEELDIRADEGYLKGASASSTAGDTDLYIHETLFGWDGWSLAVKRPGRTIVERRPDDPPHTPHERVDDVEPDNTTKFPLSTSFRVTPGTLPRLRFGHSYRLRARAVDLAGNSVPERDVVASHVTQPQTYTRFDPVPPPVVIPRRPFTEGESLLRMVIRSTLDVPPNSYVALPRITALTGHTDRLLRYLAVNQRHLAPPNCSQQMAEWHGQFDAAIGDTAVQGDIDAQFDIAALESGTFLQPGPQTFVFNPDPAAVPTDLHTLPKGAALQPGEQVFHDLDELPLPYLPDPMAHGVSFTTLPGDATTRLEPWNSSGWPRVDTFRIVIEDGTGAPAFDPARHVLTVQLPQAATVEVRLSSFVPRHQLELMGVWTLESSATRTAQQQLAEQGLQWMLTPPEVLVLVHAVEKPLTAPVVDIPAAGITRNQGETFAVLNGAIDNHAASTGRLDLEAAWQEPLDDLRDDKPTTVQRSGHVTDFELTAEESTCKIGRDDLPRSGTNPPVHKVRHEFRDTKHRWVDYHATATTRFREYFPPAITDDPALITHVGPIATRNVPSSRRPDPPEVLYVVPTWTWTERVVRGLPRPATGRGRTASGTATPRPPATTLRTRSGGGLRVYLDRPWYSSGDDELLGVVLADQPWLTWSIDVDRGLEVSDVAKAHAERAAAETLAAGRIPVRRGAAGTATERLLRAVQAEADRSQAGTRGRVSGPAAIHDAIAASPTLVALGLEASLLSSTAQTMLADLLGTWRLRVGDPDKFVTHWGQDPIWGSAPPASGPWIHQFPLRHAVGTGISLLEAPGNTVAVVGHEPHYDPLRKLWYCDLQLDAGSSYFPFVKLALARYQPYSIADMHLSKVVLADFAQLVAERTAALTKVSRGGVRITLRGPGGYTDNALDLVIGDDPLLLQQHSRFAVAQLERLPASTTTDLAWQPVGDEAHLAPSVTGGDVSYTATLTVPRAKQGEQLRLSLREYEIYETDSSEADDRETTIVDFADQIGFTRSVRYRLVYADHLSL